MTIFYRAMVFPCMMTLCVWNLAFGQLPVNKQGRVNMQGSIIDTPCAIATDDLEQTIDIGVVKASEITRDTEGAQRQFSLYLVNCNIKQGAASKADWGWFRVTFDGPTDGDLFRVSNQAGVGLKITDAVGHRAIPGEPMPGVVLTEGTQRLDYTLRLASHHRRIKTGEYYSALRFEVDYF